MRIDSQSETQPADARRSWVAPHYSKVKAGDAETGPNPDIDDNFFAKS